MKTLTQRVTQIQPIQRDPAYADLPHVQELGDGTFTGQMHAHTFEYDGKTYYSDIGVRCFFPVTYTVKIENGVQVHA